MSISQPEMGHRWTPEYTEGQRKTRNTCEVRTSSAPTQALTPRLRFFGSTRLLLSTPVLMIRLPRHDLDITALLAGLDPNTTTLRSRLKALPCRKNATVEICSTDGDHCRAVQETIEADHESSGGSKSSIASYLAAARTVLSPNGENSRKRVHNVVSDSMAVYHRMDRATSFPERLSGVSGIEFENRDRKRLGRVQARASELGKMTRS